MELDAGPGVADPLGGRTVRLSVGQHYIWVQTSRTPELDPEEHDHTGQEMAVGDTSLQILLR